MKKIEKTESPKKTTFNYAPDSHKKFCERCYKHNGNGCPSTGKKHKSSTCQL